MTCKDCIHYEACHDMYYEEHATRHFDPEKHNAEKECGYFKDRSRFVELPHALNISDMVHFILRDLDEVDLKEYKFTVGKSAVSDTVQFITEIGTYGFWVGESPREFAPDYDEFYHWHELGKTVFLTREEAEAALKEREGK